MNGKLLANAPPAPGFQGMPCLTVPMAAKLQGFPDEPPDEWRIVGLKTHAYRQVGNAFPPPVAREIGVKIAEAIKAARRTAATRAGGGCGRVGPLQGRSSVRAS